MKMAALQLMQQKANKDTKTEASAITAAPGPAADTVQTQTGAAEEGGSTNQADSDTSAASHTEIDSGENSSKPATNGPIDLAATQNGECKSPLAGKELEESIPGLAQAKELAETIVGDDGSCIGMSKTTSKPYSQECAGRATLVGSYESQSPFSHFCVEPQKCVFLAQLINELKYLDDSCFHYQVICPCSFLSML